MSRNKLIITIAAAAAIISACAPQNSKPVGPEIGEVDKRIADAFERASNANAAVAEVEVATSKPTRAAPGADLPPNVVLPAEAVQPITVDWNGPVEAFLEDVADRAGYQLVVTGRKPANGVMLTISAKNEPLFGVLRRAGMIIHGYADIGFNPGLKKIELRYGG